MASGCYHPTILLARYPAVWILTAPRPLSSNPLSHSTSIPLFHSLTIPHSLLLTILIDPYTAILL